MTEVMNRRKAALFRVILVIIGFVVGFLIAELAFRILHRPKADAAVTYVNRQGYYVYPSCGKLSFQNEEKRDSIITTDEHGLRNAPGSLGSSEIILVGDSFVSAVNSTDDETLAGQLRRKGLKVYNAGMDGFSNYHEYRLLCDLLKECHPRCVVLCFYLGNDFHDNYFQECDKEWLVPSSLRSPGTIKAGTITSAPDTEEQAGISSTGKPSHSTLRESLKAMLMKSAIVSHLISRSKTVTEGSKDIMVSYSLSEMEFFRNTPGKGAMKAAEKTEVIFSLFTDLLKKRGIEFLVLGIPSKAQVMKSFYEIALFAEDRRSHDHALDVIAKGYSFDRPDDLMKEIAADRNVPYISLLQIYRENGAEKVYYYIDHHWNAAGQAKAAELLYQRLKTLQ